MSQIELTRMCADLMLDCVLNNSSGFVIDIDTPEGTAHCKFEFTIELKNQEDE